MITRRAVATGMHHEFRKGTFVAYRATTGFHVGAHENLQIYADDVVEFDGYTLRIGNDDFSAPSLRGAIKRKWLVPEEDTNAVYHPQPAGVVMAPADTAKSNASHRVGTAAMSSDERIVGNREQVRKAADQGVSLHAPRVVSGSSVASSNVVTVDAGIEVGRVNVPAKYDAREVTRSNAHLVKTQAMNQAADASRRVTLGLDSEGLRKINAAAADTAGMSEEELAAWEEKQERRHLAALQAEAAREARRADFQRDGKLSISEHTQSQAAAQQREMSNRTASYIGGAVPFDESNLQETAHALHAMDQTGAPATVVKVGTVSGGSPSAPSAPSAPASLPRLVRTSVGIDWDLGRPSHVRMRDAIERFGWSLDILRSIAEVEEEDVARFLFNHLEANTPKAAEAPQKATVTPDYVGEDVEEDVEEDVDEELSVSDLAEGEVTSPTGLTWSTVDPPHWASRLKRALEEVTDVEDLLFIAGVETPAVASRIRKHVKKMQESE